jgi:uncharacterized membrane protein
LGVSAPLITTGRWGKADRQAERDRHQADEDYRTNVEAEQRIEDLQRRLAAAEMNKLDRILELLERRMPDKL